MSCVPTEIRQAGPDILEITWSDGRRDRYPAAVLGHTFSPFLRLRGGKGVATTLGALLALEPLATLAGVLAFFLVYLPTRVVAAGSLAAAVALPVAVFVHGTAPLATGLLAILSGALIIVRHRSNIARMLKGES